MAVKVTVLYPNEPGKKFDFDYWVNQHVPMVQQLLGPMGLIKGELDKGISAPNPNDPAPYVAVGHLYFHTVEQVHESFKTHGRQIMGDIANYSEIKPTFQISEVLG